MNKSAPDITETVLLLLAFLFILLGIDWLYTWLRRLFQNKRREREQEFQKSLEDIDSSIDPYDEEKAESKKNSR